MDDDKSYLAGWINGTKNSEKKMLVFSKKSLLKSSLFTKKVSRKTVSPWEHLSASKANHTLPIIARLATYSGGGFAADLGNNIQQAQTVTSGLQKRQWIDQYARGVFTEFTVYNPSVNLVAIYTVILEVPPYGGAMATRRAFVFKLYHSLGNNATAQTVGEIIAILILLYMIYQTGKLLWRGKKNFFKDANRYLDICLIAIGVSIVILKTIRNRYLNAEIQHFRDAPTAYIGFYKCGFYDELVIILFAFLNFFAIAKFIVFIKFVPSLQHIVRTVALCAKDISQFIVVFFMVQIAYISVCTLAFGAEVGSFKDFHTSWQSLSALTIGVFDVTDFTEPNKVLGAIVFVSFVLSMAFICVNMFKVILTQGFAQVKGNLRMRQAGVRTIDVLIEVFKDVAGIKDPDVSTPPLTPEVEDPIDILLKSQMKYIEDSQTMRIVRYLNDFYIDDFNNDVELLNFGFLPSKLK